MEATQDYRCSLELVVIRADGSREDLGVVARGDSRSWIKRHYRMALLGLLVVVFAFKLAAWLAFALGATLIVTTGKAIITNRIKAGGTEPLYIAWGTGAGTAAAADTTLFTEASESRVAGTSSQQTTTTANDTYRVTGTMTVAGAGKTITNAGLLDASTAGNLFFKSDFTGVVLNVGESIAFTFNTQLT